VAMTMSSSRNLKRSHAVEFMWWLCMSRVLVGQAFCVCIVPFPPLTDDSCDEPALRASSRAIVAEMSGESTWTALFGMVGRCDSQARERF